jgi:hypothetical protein
MKIFKRKQESRPNKASDKAAGWIASGIFKVQNYWAKKMDHFFNNRSLASRKVLVIACTVFIVGYSTVLIAYSFNKAGALMIKPISAIQPISIGKASPNLPSGVPAFIKRIDRFKHYLDSLGKSDDGRKVRDSLLLRRPGLLDSIRRIETIYCSK